jgi:hypothetical protein
MSAGSFTELQKRTTLVLPIVVGGAVAGTLDLIAAFVSSGFNVPRVIAAGLLGSQVIRSTHPAFWILGLFLHFFIAFSAAAIYCLASGKLGFLKEHFVVCGLFFGIAVFLVMYLVVMPLCAFHYKGPYTLTYLLQAVTVHMVLIGLPIAAACARLSPRRLLPADGYQ